MQAAFAARRAQVKHLSIRIVQVSCLIHLINEHVLEVRSCIGPSMYPTLALSGDYLLSIRTSTLRTFLSRTSPHVSRGDLVDFISPRDPTYSVCKRVIGIEGDIICLDPSRSSSVIAALETREAWKTKSAGKADKHAGKSLETLEEALYQRSDEDVQVEDTTPQDENVYIRVPKGSIWVAGDNLSNSNDSRDYGPLPLGLIRGKIVARVWPPSRAQWLTAARDRQAVQLHLKMPNKQSQA